MSEHSSTDIPEFDHQSEALMRAPYEHYARMRANCPVSHTGKHGGFWVISRYDDVFRTLRDHRTFSSRDGAAIPPQPFKMIPIDIDPSVHGQYRAILDPLFSPEVAQSLEESTFRIADRLIDTFIETGTADLAADYCRQLPIVVVLDHLGFPEAGRADLQRWIDVMTHERGGEGSENKVAEAGMNVAQFLLGLIAQRREAPQPGNVLDALINADIEGRALTDEEIFQTLFIILFGGLDTSTAVMLEGLHHLGKNPDAKDRLRNEPGLWDTAIEEYVRYTSPVQGLGRTATCPVTIGEAQVAENDRVMVLHGSANRDESRFDHPDQCVLDRSPNPHVGFGIGAHRCLGMHIGRMEVHVVLKKALERLPDFTVEASFEPDYLVGETRGMKELPVTFTPGRRIG